jgi:thiamine-phosphate pyrophosphorylase
LIYKEFHEYLYMDKIIRIIDANLNRGREGLRVVEDLVRFIIDDSSLASKIKSARHEITEIAKQLPIDDNDLLNARDSIGDVGIELNSASEDSRTSVLQIACANIRRAQESMRVLEELSKLYSAEVALKFKRLRFQLYEMEKQVLSNLKKERGDF